MRKYFFQINNFLYNVLKSFKYQRRRREKERERKSEKERERKRKNITRLTSLYILTHLPC